MANIGAHVVVAGDVQGVGFRYSTIRQAKNLGVRGWVRNLPDGRVEVQIEGDEARVQSMVDWCRQGPPSAIVSEIEIDLQPCTYQFHGFDVRY